VSREMGFVRSVRSVKVCWAVVSRGEGGGNDLKIVVGVLRQMALDNLFFFLADSIEQKSYR